MADENSGELVSFHHKKKTLQRIQNAINAEIYRRKTVHRMNKQIQRFGDQIDTMNEDCCSFFHNMDENKERGAQAPILR